MNMSLQLLAEKAKEFGAAAAGSLQTSDIKFSAGFRKACEQNTCGKHGTNWMCPPGVGPFDQLKERVLQFSQGTVFQTVHQLEDSFDFEGMKRGSKEHEKIFRRILEYIRSDSSFDHVFPLNAGECKFCRKCTYPEGLPCRFPDKAVASVESYGIDVTALVTSCGIPYNNGPNTVSYVGLFLF